jgi:hypothetical protein
VTDIDQVARMVERQVKMGNTSLKEVQRPVRKAFRADFRSLIARLDLLQPGQSMVYHVGLLDSDRGAVPDEDVGVRHVAAAAWKANEAGKVHLTQRRVPAVDEADRPLIEDGKQRFCFEYIATGRSAPSLRHVPRAVAVAK